MVSLKIHSKGDFFRAFLKEAELLHKLRLGYNLFQIDTLL